MPFTSSLEAQWSLPCVFWDVLQFDIDNPLPAYQESVSCLHVVYWIFNFFFWCTNLMDDQSALGWVRFFFLNPMDQGCKKRKAERERGEKGFGVGSRLSLMPHHGGGLQQRGAGWVAIVCNEKLPVGHSGVLLATRTFQFSLGCVALR